VGNETVMVQATKNDSYQFNAKWTPVAVITPKPTPTPTPTPTPKPTPTPTLGIGATVTGKNGVSFTVDSAQVEAAPDFQANPPGYVTVAIEVSLTNHGTKSVDVASLSDFEILGPQGQTYQQVILLTGPDAPDGSLTPGAEMTGDIGYQVPPGAYRIAYTPLFGTALPPISIGSLS
jgi:hypothetical protein